MATTGYRLISPPMNHDRVENLIELQTRRPCTALDGPPHVNHAPTITAVAPATPPPKQGNIRATTTRTAAPFICHWWPPARPATDRGPDLLRPAPGRVPAVAKRTQRDIVDRGQAIASPIHRKPRPWPAPLHCPAACISGRSSHLRGAAHRDHLTDHTQTPAGSSCHRAWITYITHTSSRDPAGCRAKTHRSGAETDTLRKRPAPRIDAGGAPRARPGVTMV